MKSNTQNANKNCGAITEKLWYSESMSEVKPLCTELLITEESVFEETIQI